MRNEELIVSHMDYARRIASRFQNRQALHMEISDLESEAFLGLVTAGDRFDGRGTFRGWISLRVAGAIEDFLSARNQTPFLELLDVHPVDAGLDEALDRQRITRAVSNLPENWRRVITLRYWFGYTQPEVSKQLGIGVDRIGQIQRQAFQRIREALR